METGIQVAQLEVRRASVESGLGDLRSEMRNLRVDMRAGFRAVRADARSDFRTLFGALIVATLGLAGLMARGFHWF